MKNNESINAKTFDKKGTHTISPSAQKAHKLRFLALGWMLSLFFIHQSATAQTPDTKQWNYIVGVGTAVLPAYLGDNDYQAALLVNFSANYADKFSASLLEGLRYNWVRKNHWQLGAVLKFNVGRFEEGSVPSRFLGNKTEDLKGLGDIDPSIEPGLFAAYTAGAITTKVEVRQGLGGHEGMLIELKSDIQRHIWLSGTKIQYAYGPELKWAGSNFNNAFFGIDEAQAQVTDLSVHQSKAGMLSYGINGSLQIPVGQKVFAQVFTSFSRLGKRATDSGLIINQGSNYQLITGFLFNYRL